MNDINFYNNLLKAIEECPGPWGMTSSVLGLTTHHRQLKVEPIEDPGPDPEEWLDEGLAGANGFLTGVEDVCGREEWILIFPNLVAHGMVHAWNFEGICADCEGPCSGSDFLCYGCRQASMLGV